MICGQGQGPGVMRTYWSKWVLQWLRVVCAGSSSHHWTLSGLYGGRQEKPPNSSSLDDIERTTLLSLPACTVVAHDFLNNLGQHNASFHQGSPRGNWLAEMVGDVPPYVITNTQCDWFIDLLPSWSRHPQASHLVISVVARWWFKQSAHPLDT